jgi:hypothetical protein
MSMPSKCSEGCVLIERMIDSLSMIVAQRGINSLMCTPGKQVGILRNGPAVRVPGFGSQVSN